MARDLLWTRFSRILLARLHIELEKKFVVGHLILVSAGYLAYGALASSGHAVVAAVILVVGTSAVATWLAHHGLFMPMRRLQVQPQAPKRDPEALMAALEQLRHSDRIATLGRLASSVAHELGNPLNVIELRAQLISSGDADTLHQAQQSAAVIVEQTRRMTGIIDQILSFARMQPTRVVRLDLLDVLRKAIELTAHTSKKLKTVVHLDTAEAAIEIDGDPDKLLQVIVNLVVNGMQAMPNGGMVRVSTVEELRAPIDDPGGAQRRYVCVGIADQGLGITPEAAPRIFEPFFSTRTADGGTGLGLSVAQGIAREHEGWISVESELGLGSSFKVHLPTHAPKAHDGHAR